MLTLSKSFHIALYRQEGNAISSPPVRAPVVEEEPDWPDDTPDVITTWVAERLVQSKEFVRSVEPDGKRSRLM